MTGTQPARPARAARRTLRLAHRGDWRAAPENTLTALIAALRIPDCDGLEFDVRGSADGVPVVIHDATLLRVQQLDANVRDLTADELGRHGVPTLAEVLGAVGPGPFLDVELKGEPVPAVVSVLEAARGPLLDHTVISSFEAGTLAWLGDRRPVWPRWLNALSLAAPWRQAARELGCAGIAAEWTSLDEASVAGANTEGLEVAAWTVRDLVTFRRLAGLGVIAICAEAEALDG